MTWQEIVASITDKGGVIAAIAVLVSLAGGFLGIVRPWLQRRRERKEGMPALQFGNVRAEDPPPWSDAARATFELLNGGGGRAVMTDLHLLVLECGSSEEPRMVQAAAPVPQFTYKVTLDPDVRDYDVRKREFGTEGPHTFDKQEVESIVVELRSRRPQWYRLQFVARWYDARHPGDASAVHSDIVRVEFPPDVSDLLGLDTAATAP